MTGARDGFVICLRGQMDTEGAVALFSAQFAWHLDVIMLSEETQTELSAGEDFSLYRSTGCGNMRPCLDFPVCPI